MQGFPRQYAAPAAAAVMAIIGYYDAHTSYEMSLWAFYIAPVALIAWRFGFAAGCACATASVGLLMLAAYYTGHPYSTAAYFAFALAGQFTAYVVIAWYAVRLAVVQSILEKLLSGPEVATFVKD